ncbi:fumarylacetoacetate hydrolase family protein [Colwelliaceae bacterium 6471]
MKTVQFNDKSVTPSKIICIGRNYVDHIAELGNEVPDEMVVFIKPNSAISDELMSYHQEPLHYEAEICFMVENGQFAAVAVGLDLTKRALQTQLKTKGLPWERAKAFDGAAVFSDFVAIDNIENSLTVALRINEQLMQVGSVELMIYSPSAILNELKSFITLQDGDIVMTGTPKGVGVVNAGDTFTGSIYDNKQNLVAKEWQAK